MAEAARQIVPVAVTAAESVERAAHLGDRPLSVGRTARPLFADDRVCGGSAPQGDS